MKLYAVRHGLTNHNKLKLINGQSIDEGLEPEGMIQAEEAAHKIPNGIVHMYVSDMNRTRQTAEIINKKLGLPISFHPELREVHFGSFSGRSWENVAKDHGPHHREEYLSASFDFIPHGGESVVGVRDRLDKLISELKKKHDDQMVLIVAHGGILRILYHMYGNKEKLDYIENGSIHEFEI